MDFTYENQGTNTYLVYKLVEDDVMDTMSLGMLTNNKISGLAQTIFMQMDDTKYIKYNVSSKVSVCQFFSGPVNKKRLIGVFSGIVDAMISAEEYMIDPNSIILDLNYIFADVSTCETVLICLPLEKENNTKTDMGMLFKNIVFSTQFDRTENCDYVAKLINYLNGSPVFSLTDFKKVLDDINMADNASKVQITNSEVSKPQPSPGASVPKMQKPQMRQPAPASKNEYSYAVKPKQSNVANSTINPIREMEAGGYSGNNNIPNISQSARQMAAAQEVKNEKKISMFGLLTHYSKENAQLYKMQKQQKKEMSAHNAAAVNKPDKKKQLMDFAIPGQAVPISHGNMAQQQNQALHMKQHGENVQSVRQNMQTVPMMQTNFNQQPQYYQTNSTVQSVNFGETTVLNMNGNIGETTVLGAACENEEKKPYLVRKKNNEKILIDKPVFRIGKEKSYVDYFIGDNTAISRSHANIITRDGEYFITDTNSTNHTYVNGVMIQSNVETKLADGIKIKLSNEDFEFRLY